MGYQGKPENDNPDDGTPEYLTVITFYATILLTHRNVRPYRILKCIYFKNIKEKSPNPQVKIKVKWPKVLSHSYLYHFGPLQPVSLNTYQAMSTKSARIQGLRPQGGMLGLDPTHTITLIHTVEVHAKCQPPGAKTMTIEGWGTFFVD